MPDEHKIENLQASERPEELAPEEAGAAAPAGPPPGRVKPAAARTGFLRMLAQGGVRSWRDDGTRLHAPGWNHAHGSGADPDRRGVGRRNRPRLHGHRLDGLFRHHGDGDRRRRR